MSENFTRREVWPVNLRDSEGNIFEQEVTFLQYTDIPIDDTVIAADVGENEGYVIALLTLVHLEGTDGGVSGIVVRKFPSDEEDPVYISACRAITDGTAAGIYGGPYDSFTLERLREGMNIRAEDPWSQL